MYNLEECAKFYAGKRVFVTGHTGFKGSWLVRILTLAGARVTGYALLPPTKPSLFAAADLAETIDSVEGDVRDLSHMQAVFERARPELVFHLAAQPIVRTSFEIPVMTYETNVMGTVHVLECIRNTKHTRSFVNVTTDKVYENREWAYGYRECDRLDGWEPYANSKSCSELVTASYRRSFFADGSCAVSAVRAGNVIGGGDFAAARIIPDCFRAVSAGEPVLLRNPCSTRPYQHVLEPLFFYLELAEKQFSDAALSGAYNVGPDEEDCVTTGALAGLFCEAWGGDASWVSGAKEGPHEANELKLDCSKIRKVFGWRPQYGIGQAVQLTADWYRGFQSGRDARAMMDAQIKAYRKADTLPRSVS